MKNLLKKIGKVIIRILVEIIYERVDKEKKEKDKKVKIDGK